MQLVSKHVCQRRRLSMMCSNVELSNKNCTCVTFLHKANVELFEVWPRSCEWPAVCHGRHPAPWSRIVHQMVSSIHFPGLFFYAISVSQLYACVLLKANEAAALGDDATLIAWEW